MTSDISRRSRARLLSRLLPASIVALLTIAACGQDDPVNPTPVSLSLATIGSYEGGAQGASEITAYDAKTKRLFVVNGANGTVDVLF
jgi:hypothetical protein